MSNNTISAVQSDQMDGQEEKQQLVPPPKDFVPSSQGQGSGGHRSTVGGSGNGSNGIKSTHGSENSTNGSQNGNTTNPLYKVGRSIVRVECVT